MKITYPLILAVSLLGAPLAGAAQEKPLIEIPAPATDIDIKVPAFVKKGANHINLNGADWGSLKEAFRRSQSSPVSIVLIGDSHVQSDMPSGTTRELLQLDFGNAGRGLVAPLKMAGTNQSADYTFSSPGSWNSARIIATTWRQPMGFTGISIRPLNSTGTLEIGTNETDADDYNPFTSLTIFHGGKFSVSGITDENNQQVGFREIPSRDYLQLLLERPVTKANVSFASGGDLTIYGASLADGGAGVLYHSIGNNGATYSLYNRIGSMGVGIAPLSPDLVIISLGTNEASGNISVASLTKAIDRLVSNIKAANPEAQILLTTPMEFQSTVTTTKAVKVPAKGKKKKKARTRTVNRTSTTYAINRNVASVREAILNYGRDNTIAVWDWYDVAGGSGASTAWIGAGLFNKDRIHHTRPGYEVEGRMLYEALLDVLRN